MVERVRASTRARRRRHLPANYDKEKVIGLYNDYITKIGNAMRDASGEGDAVSRCMSR